MRATPMVIGVCVFLCSCGSGVEPQSRGFDQAKKEYTFKASVDGDDVSHTYGVGEVIEIDDLSFGMNEAKHFKKYGVIKGIDVLSPRALETYKTKYLIPRKGCPASFMNQHLETLMLIPETDALAESLASYDIPFNGEGAPFKLKGAVLDHLENRYVEDGESINLTIPKHIDIMSNKGSARRKVRYVLVKELL